MISYLAFFLTLKFQINSNDVKIKLCQRQT